MSTPLEQIRQHLARHDAEIVRRLAQRAARGAAPDAFYTPGWADPIFRSLPPEVALPPHLHAFHTQIESGFTSRVLPLLVPPTAAPATDDGALRAADADALAAIAFRLGLSLQVAACKLDGRDTRLRAAAEAGDAAAIESLITYPSVEQLVLLRVRSRAAEYVRTHNLPPALASRLPDALDAAYHDWLIPLSRAIQAAWLIHRISD